MEEFCDFVQWLGEDMSMEEFCDFVPGVVLVIEIRNIHKIHKTSIIQLIEIGNIQKDFS